MAEYPMDDYDLSSLHLNPRRYMLDDELYHSPTLRDSSDALDSQSGEDMYDFDFKQHSARSKGKGSSKRKPTGRPSDPKARRASLDERTQAILRHPGGASAREAVAPTESIEDAWKSIMGDDPPRHQPSLSPDLKRSMNDHFGSLDSPSDSIDISAADFEVGVIAARKKEQLASTRASLALSKELEHKRGADDASKPQHQLAQSVMFKSQLSSIRGSLEHDDTFEPTDHDLLHNLHGVVHGNTTATATGDRQSGYSDEEFEPDTATLEESESQQKNPSAIAPTTTTALSPKSSMEDIRRRWLEEPNLLLSSLTMAPKDVREPKQPIEPEKPRTEINVSIVQPVNSSQLPKDAPTTAAESAQQEFQEEEATSAAEEIAETNSVDRSRTPSPQTAPTRMLAAGQTEIVDAVGNRPDRERQDEGHEVEEKVPEGAQSQDTGEDVHQGELESVDEKLPVMGEERQWPTTSSILSTTMAGPTHPLQAPTITDASFEDMTQCRSPPPPPAPDSPRVSFQDQFAVDTSVASLPPPPPASATMSIACSDTGNVPEDRSVSHQQSYALNRISTSFDHPSGISSYQPVYHLKASAMLTGDLSAADKSVMPNVASNRPPRDSLQTELYVNSARKSIKTTDIAANDNRPRSQPAHKLPQTARAPNSKATVSPLLDKIKKKGAAKRVAQTAVGATSATKSRKLNLSGAQTSAIVKQMETLQKEMKELKTTVEQGRRTRAVAAGKTPTRPSQRATDQKPLKQPKASQSSKNHTLEEASSNTISPQPTELENNQQSETAEPAPQNEKIAAQFAGQQQDLLHLLEEYKAQLETAQSRTHELETAPALPRPLMHQFSSAPTLIDFPSTQRPGPRLLGDADAQAILLAASVAINNTIPLSPRESTDSFMPIQPVDRKNECGQRIIQAIATFEETKTMEGDEVPISRQLLNEACKELHYQESLLAGYQKENEALVAQAKKARKQLEEEQQALEREKQLNNIQLRKLHNDTVRVSYRELRTELDLDAARRTYEEQFAQQAQELKFTIDQLRKEAQNSSMQHQQELSQAAEDRTALQRELDSERERHQHEMTTLRQRLTWYVENQELLDKKDALISKQADELRSLRNKGTHPSANDTMDNSKMSNVSVINKKARHRNGADVRRIQELEEQLRTMEESLRKRHPDSVANLIRANDVVQERERALESSVQRLQQQLEASKDETETRLRTLRQEHDKLKLYYETKISQLQHQLEHGQTGNASRPESPILEDSNSSNCGDLENDTPHTLEEALRQIQSLKKDCERIRMFYTNKLRKAKDKTENVIRAMKRGEEPLHANKDGSDKLTMRIKELERQLAVARAHTEQTHEEDDSLDAQFWPPDDRLRPPVTPAPRSKQQSILLTREAGAQTEYATSNVQQSPSVQAPVTPPNDARLEQLQARLQFVETDRTRMMDHTRALEEQLAQLRMNQTPDSVRYAVLATQLDDMERRFVLREQEFQWAIQESRQAAKVEHGRLQALHQTELFGKDRQLLALRSELDAFVETLHNLTHRAAPSPAIVQTF